MVETIGYSPSVSCQNEKPWLYGNQFIKFLKVTNFNGYSGFIGFDHVTGYRNNLTLSIVDKTRTGVDLVGSYSFNINID